MGNNNSKSLPGDVSFLNQKYKLKSKFHHIPLITEKIKYKKGRD